MQYRSVTRLALLIGSPGKSKNYLRGVPADLHNLRNFLLSPNGGRWNEDEIISLPRAQVSDVASIIQRISVDYLFVYFTGHGYTEAFSNKRILSIQDYDIEDLFLLNQSPRQLILVDACRNYIAPGISGIPEFDEEPLGFDGESVARKLFDRSILLSPAGKVIIHGTQRGKFSIDSPYGGYFTRALLHVGTNINANTNYTVASIEKVLLYVPSVLKRNGNFQTPEVTYRTGNMNVPFAIGIPKPIYKTSPQRGVVEKQTNIFGEIAVSALTLLLIGAVFSDNK